ncbi:MAG TPA: hypothetical protein PK263_05795, partial [bacterium]|nr:hypothetical protein [bacterium]
MSAGIEELSVEELERIQREHEEKLAAQRAAEEEERHRQAQIKAGTDADYARRPSVIAEARAAQREVDKMEAEQIGEKIKKTKDLQRSESAKQAELAAITSDLDQASARLQMVSRLVEGKNEDEISEPVRQALEAATLRESSIRSKKEALDKEIAELRADQVSDDQVRRYRSLVESVEGLVQQIDGIDANPAMREILEDEALGEDKLRDEAVRAAEGITYGSNHNKTKQQLAAVIAQQFITEELEREGIQSISNPEERQVVLVKFMEEMTTGIRSWKKGDRENLLRWGNTSPAKKAGVALGLLVAGISNSSGLYEGIEEFHGGDTSEFISAHLGSINFARGYDKGMTRHHRLLGDLTRPWEQFEQRAV